MGSGEILELKCCGHIVADTDVSPFARARNICCGHKFCVRDTKNVSDFVQKHFVSSTIVSQFAQPKKHHGQQCVLVYQGLKKENCKLY